MTTYRRATGSSVRPERSAAGAKSKGAAAGAKSKGAFVPMASLIADMSFDFAGFARYAQDERWDWKT